MEKKNCLEFFLKSFICVNFFINVCQFELFSSVHDILTYQIKRKTHRCGCACDEFGKSFYKLKINKNGIERTKLSNINFLVSRAISTTLNIVFFDMHITILTSKIWKY
jgi:hypothetical protein